MTTRHRERPRPHRATRPAPTPADETRRLQALQRYQIMDTPSEAEFDDLAALAAEICRTPMALVALLDDERQWFKARVGVSATETPRGVAFCAHALHSSEMLVVPDARVDPRFAQNPHVLGEPGIRFYAGAPLVTPDGHTLGTLCVIDQVPRQLTASQRHALQVLSRQVMANLELRFRVQRQQAIERSLREIATRLETQNARLVEAQAVAKVGSWETDLTTLDVVWSDETHRIFETDPARFHPTHARFLERVHPEDRGAVDQAFGTSASQPGPCTIEHRILLPGDRLRHVEERWQVYRDAAGRPVRATGTCRDITENRLAAEALRTSEERFREMADNIGDVFYNFDPVQGRLLYANKAYEEIWGRPLASVYADPLSYLDAVHAEDRAGAEAAYARQLAGEETHTQFRVLRPDGDFRWVHEHAVPILGRDGRVERIVGTMRDITDRKNLEARSLRAQRLESLGTLAGGIAHDLNNLLAPIVMGVDLLKVLISDTDTLRTVHNIERSARRGKELVRQVLSFARGVEGARVAIPVGHLGREIEEIVRNTFPKNIVFESDLPRDLWLTTGDPTQLNQVLLNLCVNARDAMPHGGRLRLAACNLAIDRQFATMTRHVAAGRYVRIDISDTGTGIDPEAMERIFEPFFTTKELGQGTGLGLSTAIGIVRSHGGIIDVTSTVGRGSTFSVYLPARPDDTTSADQAPPAAVVPPRGRGQLVLVVDDEATVRDITRQTLESFGYRVVSAEDGAQAVTQYATHRADIAVVLTDMMMPVMDGPALIAALRRIEPRLAIIATTGLDTEDSHARAAAAGVRHFLAKPYSAEALLDILGRVVTE